MTGGWKKTLLKLLLGLHILLLPAAVLLWGKGYVALTRHLHEGVLYEITSILSPYYWYKFDYRFGSVIGSGGDATLFRSATGDMLYVPVSDHEESGFSDLIIIWGEQMDEDFRYIQPPESPDSLVWVEGVERMGNKEPTLIVYGTVELEREWQSKEILGAPTYHGMAVLSQRVYNLDRLWLNFYSIRDSAGKHVMPYSVPAMRIQEAAFITPIDSPGERWIPKGLTSKEILERLRLYRPGFMPVDYRLSILGASPAGEDILWPQVPGGSGIWEYHWLVLIPLAIVTYPYRILFYLPLLLSPRILVWPVAVLWGALWIVGWGWCIVAYRRLRATADS